MRINLLLCGFGLLALFCLNVVAVVQLNANTAQQISGGWSRGIKVEPDRNHSIIFAIKPALNALDTCDSVLMDISDPKSPHYGQHLTLKEVGQLLTNPASLKTVLAWIEGKSRAMQKALDVKSTYTGDFVILNAEIGDLEALLSASFYYFTTNRPKSPQIMRTDSISLPAEVIAHLDFVYNTVNFPFLSARISAYQSQYGSDTVTPSLLTNFYKISTTPVTNPGATQSLFETLDQDFSAKDLETFQYQYSLKQTPIAKVIGPNNGSKCENYYYDCIEANLDVQYILAIAQGAHTTYWSIPNSAQDPFLDWIIALGNTTNPPLVHSISYDSVAQEDQVSNVFRFSLELCKLGLRGLTVFASSGDDGVANYEARTNASLCGFHPAFPATCPYVTAVGATQGPESGQPEVACSSATGGMITTGGGFSYYFKRPSWQTAAVAHYFATVNSLPPSNLYNTTSRGYPDVAAMGYNYNIVDGGQTIQISGTSASTPVFAGLITLINNDRLNAKKKPLGFINPALYGLNSNAFNDITEGQNNCCAGFFGQVCCEWGFNATTGWDPLTGLGTPRFPALKAALVALP